MLGNVSLVRNLQCVGWSGVVTRAHRARRGGRGAARRGGAGAEAAAAAPLTPPVASAGTPAASCLERYRRKL